MYFHNSLQGELSANLYDFTERRLLETCAWFPPNLTNVAFPCADFGLYLLAVINHNHEYDYMLSPVSPSSKSLNIGIVLGISSPTHIPISKAGEICNKT